MTPQDIEKAKDWLKVKRMLPSTEEVAKITIEIISVYERQEKEMADLKSAVNWQKEVIKARDEELAELRACHDSELGTCYKHCPELAELRGALKKIVEASYSGSSMTYKDINDIARQALAKDKQGGSK
jgi:hypothetical protein